MAKVIRQIDRQTKDWYEAKNNKGVYLHSLEEILARFKITERALYYRLHKFDREDWRRR
jgi:hypothetical protein